MDPGLERLENRASDALEVGPDIDPLGRPRAERVEVAGVRLADVPDDLRDITPAAAWSLPELDALGCRDRGVERRPAGTEDRAQSLELDVVDRLLVGGDDARRHAEVGPRAAGDALLDPEGPRV